MPTHWPPAEWAEGLKCDARDEFGTWYKAKVVSVGTGEQAGSVLVHYMGWSSKHDEWVSIAPLNNLKLAKWKSKAGKRQLPAKPDSAESAPSDAGADSADASPMEEEEAAEAEEGGATAAAAAGPEEEEGGSPTKKAKVDE